MIISLHHTPPLNNYIQYTTTGQEIMNILWFKHIIKTQDYSLISITHSLQNTNVNVYFVLRYTYLVFCFLNTTGFTAD